MSDELSDEEFRAMKAMYSETIASLHAESETLTRHIAALEAQLAAQSEEPIPESELEDGADYLCIHTRTGRWQVLRYRPPSYGKCWRWELHGYDMLTVLHVGEVKPIRKLTPPPWATPADKEKP